MTQEVCAKKIYASDIVMLAAVLFGIVVFMVLGMGTIAKRMAAEAGKEPEYIIDIYDENIELSEFDATLTEGANGSVYLTATDGSVTYRITDNILTVYDGKAGAENLVYTTTEFSVRHNGGDV